MSLGLAAGRPADDTTWAIGETERGKVELEPLARLITSWSGGLDGIAYFALLQRARIRPGGLRARLERGASGRSKIVGD